MFIRNIKMTELACFVLAGMGLSLMTPPAQADSRGEALYLQYCSVCHQPDGKGVPGFFPPLAGNPLVASDDPAKIQVFLKRVVFGHHGGLIVKGHVYSGTMPPIGYHGRINDSELLDLINYQREAWGNNASPISPTDLAKAREQK